MEREKEEFCVEKRHLFGGGTMETKYVIYDIGLHKTIEKYYDSKRQAEKALDKLLRARGN